jgi:uncharacterized protein (DUF2237 family)
MTDGTAKLTGITRDSGCCDRCDRDLGLIFQVVYPDGSTASLGRKCAAKATGFRPDRVAQAAKAAARLTLVAARVRQAAAVYPTALPDDVHQAATDDRLWDGTGYAHRGGFADWRDYLAGMAARGRVA